MNALNIKVNFRSGLPLYAQIMGQIKHMIATGDLQPGEQLPTVRQMAADLRVNFNTVARAYRMLDEAGYISTQHGRGTFILAPESARQTEQLLREDLQRLTAQYLHDAADLGFNPAAVRRLVTDTLNTWETAGELPEIETDAYDKNRRQK